MLEKLRALWRERRRETLLGGIVLILVVVSLSINMRSIGKKATRFATNNEEIRQAILQKQQHLQTLIQTEYELRVPVYQLEGARMKFWLAKDGKPEQEFRRRIEQCAKGSGIRLKTVGTLQNTKLTEGLNSYEISITADIHMKELLTFLQRIEQEKPQITWKNLTITPDNANAPNFLILNGTLKILVVNANEITQQLWSE